MCLHLVGLVVIYALPRFIRGERTQQSKTVSVPATNGLNPNVIASESDTETKSVRTNGVSSHPETRFLQTINEHKNEQFIDDLPIKSEQCDINVNTDKKLETKATSGANDSANNGLTDAARSSSNNSISNEYRQQITRNIEEFIDKTVTGIVELKDTLKDDLMRVNQDEMYSTNVEYGNGIAGTSDDGLRKRNLTDAKEIETFLRKEINNANVLPAVLSNGHAD